MIIEYILKGTPITGKAVVRCRPNLGEFVMIEGHVFGVIGIVIGSDQVIVTVTTEDSEAIKALAGAQSVIKPAKTPKKA